MKILIAKPLDFFDKYPYEHLGRMIAPRYISDIDLTEQRGIVWGADNGGFKGFNEYYYVRMLEMLQGYNPKFVTAPDVIFDREATLDLFYHWEPIIHRHDLPISLVLQDGMTIDDVPWDKLESVFVGGGDDFKLGQDVAVIIKEARARGKWCHMGRVNSVKRLWYAYMIGCQSVDGTGYAKFPDDKLPRAMRALDYLNKGVKHGKRRTNKKDG